MNLKNDDFCSWINDLGKREDHITLNRIKIVIS